jgi:hypothetical protein
MNRRIMRAIGLGPMADALQNIRQTRENAEWMRSEMGLASPQHPFNQMSRSMALFQNLKSKEKT